MLRRGTLVKAWWYNARFAPSTGIAGKETATEDTGKKRRDSWLNRPGLAF